MPILNNITDLYNALRPLILSDVQNSVVQTGSSATSGGSASPGSAPVDAQYLTLAASGTLNSERVFTLAANSGLSGTDGGANSAYTLALGTPSTLGVSTTNALSGSNHTHAITSSSAPGAAASLLASDASGILTLPQFIATTKVRAPLIDTASGALTLTPATAVAITDGKTLNGSTTFVSGFAGAGWRIDQGVSYASQSTIEADNLVVRGLMRVYELVINKIRVSRGSLIVSPGGGKVASVSGGGPYTLTFDDSHGLATNDLLRAQKFTGSGTYQSLLTVTGVPTSSTATVTLSSGSAPAAGYEYAVVGNTSTSSRQGGLFLTADDSGAPFLDIYDGVAAHADFNTYAKTKARLGKLSGITDSFFGTLTDYGLYTSRAYLTGAYINGSLIIGPGVGFSVPALMHCAFDTPRQGNAVNTNGHKGQVPTITGGVSGMMGKFSGAVAVGEATTNRILNPSIETNTTGYGSDGTVTLTRSAEYALFGQYSLKWVHSSGSANVYYNVSGTLGTSTTFTFSVYARKGDGSAPTGVTMSVDSTLGSFSPTITDVGGGWYRIYGTRAIGGSLGNHVVGLTNLGSGTTWYFDGWQVEARGYTTPYVDGSLGSGFAWTGTAHASTSSRTAAVLAYPNLRNINPLKGSVSAWILMEYYKTSTGAVIWNAGDASGEFVGQISNDGKVQLYINGNQITHQTATPAGWHHVVYTWDIPNNTMRVYLDGVASTSAGTPTTTPPTLHASTIQVGGSSPIGTTYNWNGLIDDFAILDRVLTADEVTAIYNSNAPLNVSRSNYELMLTEDGCGKVIANAAGIYGTDTAGKPTFSLVNVNSTVNGESLTSGDALLGDNSASKGNVLFDQSAGTLNIRAGTTNVLSFGSTGVIDGVMTLGASGGIYQGSSGSFASPNTGIKIWRESGTGDGWIGVFDSGGYTLSLTPSNALTIVGGTAYSGKRAVNFVNSSGARLGEMTGYTDGSTHNAVALRSYSSSSSLTASTGLVAGNTHANGNEQILLWAAKFTDPNSFSKPWSYIDLRANSNTNYGYWNMSCESTSEAIGISGTVTNTTSSISMNADNLYFTGTKSGFYIDHPLHPLTKTLAHTPVDGDQMYTFYAGEVMLDANGAATVEMPDWFSALNGRCMYQLTCIDEHAPVYVTEQRSGGKLSGAHRFTIQGGHAGLRVCWQVTGIRQDAWALYQPFVVEADKKPEQRGTLIKGKARRRPEMTYRPRQPETQQPIGST